MVSVLLYVPNVIGYIRLVLMILSWEYAYKDPQIFIILYALTYGLDMMDGLAARAFNQCSKFGAVLDMVLDRITTASIFAILGGLDYYKDKAIIFYCLLGLDLGSHWLHVSSTYMAGDASHKGDNETETFFVRLYYKSRFVLTTL